MRRAWLVCAACCCAMGCELFDGVLPTPDMTTPVTMTPPDMTSPDIEEMPLPDVPPDTPEEMDPPPSDWHAPEWRRRVRLEIEAEHVPGERVMGVVALVVLERSRIELGAIQAQGEDLRFLTEEGDPIPHEVESIDETDGTIHVWVRLPAVGPDEPNALWLYYDNPDASPEPRAADVWQGYGIVHHFSTFDDAGLPQDSTSAGLHAQSQTDTIGYAPSGVAGMAPFFVAANQDHIILGSHDALKSTPDSQVTIELWFMIPNVVTAQNTLFTDEDRCRGLGLMLGTSNNGDGGTLIGRFFSNPSAQPSCGTDQNTYMFDYQVPTMRWQHVAMVVDRPNLRLELWRDGEREDEILRLENFTREQSAAGARLYLGNFFSDSDKAFNGYLDEFRVYLGSRDEAWMRLQGPIGRDLFFRYGQPETQVTF